MGLRIAIMTCFLAVTGALSTAQPTAQDQILQMTRDWLQNVSKGDRASLNRIMDARCLITTPIGDVLTKDRLVPDDEAHAVQRLPLMELEGPMVRLYGDIGVLMSHLRPTESDGQQMNGTFVYRNQNSSWKLVGLHLADRR
jgi:hypothetical protein